MNLLYLSNERIPSGYANTIQQMQMCEAFADVGLQVHLIRPFYFGLANNNDTDIRQFYGVKNNFSITTLPTLLSLSKPKLGEAANGRLTVPYIGGASMIAATWLYAFSQLITGRLNKPTIVYSRNINSASVFLNMRSGSLRSKPVRLVMEAHAPTQEPMNSFINLVRKVDGIISITNALKSDLIERYGLAADRILVEPDGVNLELIETLRMSKEDARRQLGLPTDDRKIISYCGAILPGRGVEVIVETAKQFDEQVIFLIVGGSTDDITALKMRTDADRPNLKFVGFQPPGSIPMYHQASDVLLLPYTYEGKTASCTSPLKLFEYMASGRPIVASKLPVLQEVLQDNENALLADVDDPQAMANAIRRVLTESTLGANMSQQALIDVQRYSWKKRAERITRFIERTFIA